MRLTQLGRMMQRDCSLIRMTNGAISKTPAKRIYRQCNTESTDSDSYRYRDCQHYVNVKAESPAMAPATEHLSHAPVIPKQIPLQPAFSGRTVAGREACSCPLEKHQKGQKYQDGLPDSIPARRKSKLSCAAVNINYHRSTISTTRVTAYAGFFVWNAPFLHLEPAPEAKRLQQQASSQMLHVHNIVWCQDLR